MQGERSFHIFYQMLRGANSTERAAWKLPSNLETFRYLSGAGAVTTIDGIDDGADFRVVRAAMTAVRISEELQAKMFCIVAAVLWLGNVSFVATSDDATAVQRDDAFAAVRHSLFCLPFFFGGVIMAVPCGAQVFTL
jgi:myosin V